MKILQEKIFGRKKRVLRGFDKILTIRKIGKRLVFPAHRLEKKAKLYEKIAVPFLKKAQRQKRKMMQKMTKKLHKQGVVEQFFSVSLHF